MLELVRNIKSVFKIHRIYIDNTVFRLHYLFTVFILLAFCIIVTTRQYVGEPITCIQSDEISDTMMNTYCWIHTTHSIPRAFYKEVGKDVPYPGVDSVQDEKEFRYHKYYQWVCFVLFLQAALFYMPRWAWKVMENGKMESISKHLDFVICANENEILKKKKLLIDYIVNNAHQHQHDWYAYKYFSCELAAFINVIGQMFLMDRFFDGEFLNYGLEVLQFAELDQKDRTDPMIRIFPRMTKCRFHKYGHSGNVELHDALCILPLNIINEKIYIFLWFWFIILAVLTGFVLLFRIALIVCPFLRIYMFNAKYRILRIQHVHTIVRHGSIGDWFLIYLLGQNIDILLFREIVADLATNIVTEPKEITVNA
ncbi:innexin shaking-B-like [Centruroides sculpturatus]|uniref:innexin shaking-B-like n=1 Tax=Centruroides sculpturatus TaxID=218467 RepID=UPI000C6D210C|nr:innexin shaking-B-like [Centruroides sculpturatus]